MILFISFILLRKSEILNIQNGDKAMVAVSYEQAAPSNQEAEVARAAYNRILGQLSLQGENEQESMTPVRVLVIDAELETPIELPTGAVRLLLNILEAMGDGYGVTMMPVGAELTTSQAAGILNVSRPYIVKLVEEGELPHHKVGKHRRLKLEDVVAYKSATKKRSQDLLGELIDEAQELGMGY